MKPFDPRLFRDIQSVKGTIGFAAVLSFFSSALYVVASIAFAHIVTDTFLDHRTLSEVFPTLVLAAGAWVLRGFVNSLSDVETRRGGLQAVADARRIVVARISETSPRELKMHAGALQTLLTRGVDGLEIYVSRYLPQLAIASFVPLGLGAVILWLDPLSAVILIITIPLIPLFMALVGWFTQSSVEKHWQEVNRLSSTIADLMNGLPELKIFGRSHGLAQEIRSLGTQQADATLKVLRLSFLSAFVLELLSTISVALIAVAIGVRLVNGEIDLWRGLAALIIAPEVYMPLRLVGLHFHAAAEGVEAWNQLQRVLDAPQTRRGNAVLTGAIHLEWDHLTAEFDNHSFEIPDGKVESGSITVIEGPSGCGKSTLLGIILGSVTTFTGRISLINNGQEFSPIDLDSRNLHTAIGYVGQNAWLGEGSVREAISPPNRRVTSAEIESILHSLALNIPLNTRISDRSQGVSVGQRRRLAIARELLRNPQLLILDEPAAALDEESEQAVMEVLRRYADDGNAVLIVAHRASVIEAADVIVSFSSASAR